MINKFLDIFIREPKNIKSYNEYFLKTKDLISFKKIKHIFFDAKKFFNIKNFDDYLVFAFEFTRNWVKKNELYTDDYIESLEMILTKLNIYNYLNSDEHEYLIHIKAIVFAKKRNLKKLIVDFPLEKYNNDMKRKIDESVYYSFDDSDFMKSNMLNNKLVDHGSIYISNTRIICSKDLIIFSIKINDIQSYKMGKVYFEFTYNNVKYYINTRDNYEFFVSFERILYTFYG